MSRMFTDTSCPWICKTLYIPETLDSDEDNIILDEEITDPDVFFNFPENQYNPNHFIENSTTISNIFLQPNYRSQETINRDINNFVINADFEEKESSSGTLQITFLILKVQYG